MEKRVANSEPSNDKHYDLLSLLTLLSAGNPYREESKPTMVAPKRRNISNGDLYGPSIAGVNFPTNCFPSPRGRTTALRAACATPACLPHRESGGGCLQPSPLAVHQHLPSFSIFLISDGSRIMLMLYRDNNERERERQKRVFYTDSLH